MKKYMWLIIGLLVVWYFYEKNKQPNLYGNAYGYTGNNPIVRSGGGIVVTNPPSSIYNNYNNEA